METADVGGDWEINGAKSKRRFGVGGSLSQCVAGLSSLTLTQLASYFHEDKVLSLSLSLSPNNNNNNSKERDEMKF